MDAVTYPDPNLREMAKDLVCIRIDFDKNPDLAKRYGVQPLADLRILDPDGREVAKLVGFSSAARLLTACRAALDRLAGKPPAETVASSRSTGEPVEVSKAAIDAAIERGRRFLLSSYSSGGSASSGVVSEDQVLFACFACGLDGRTEDAQKLRRSVGSAPLASTYQAAFRALALSRFDPA